MRSSLKTIALLAACCVVPIALLEAGSALIYARFKGRPFSRAEIGRRLLGAERDPEEIDPRRGPGGQAEAPHFADQHVILHPYLGYVVDPKRRGVNDYGFFQASPLTKRGPGKFVLIIFGGSVADQLFTLGRDELVRVLGQNETLRDKEIEIVSTALGGYKQPQQLILLSYLLALGAEYDAVVNLDGFNEVDAPHDNMQDGINPFYPLNWNLHARQGFDPQATAHVAATQAIRDRRARLRGIFSRVPLRQSVFFLSLWDFLDQRQEVALRAETSALSTALAGERSSPQVAGPPVNFGEPDDADASLADVWQRSSLQMANLCRSSGIRYVHALQPNQYLPGSKRLTAEEREVAFDTDVAATRRVENGYPLLIERGAELRDLGVTFIDLSMLYRDEPGTIYTDTCCHVNGRGAEMMAAAVGRAVGEGIVTGDQALPENSDRSENHENTKGRKHERFELEGLLTGGFLFRGSVLS